MALSSSSTVADALAQYNDNLDWDGDATKAAAALAAIRFLQANRPESNTINGRSFNFAALDGEKIRIQRAIDAADTTTRCSFTRARMLSQ